MGVCSRNHGFLRNKKTGMRKAHCQYRCWLLTIRVQLNPGPDFKIINANVASVRVIFYANVSIEIDAESLRMRVVSALAQSCGNTDFANTVHCSSPLRGSFVFLQRILFLLAENVQPCSL